jgi:hypothetical protein
MDETAQAVPRTRSEVAAVVACSARITSARGVLCGLRRCFKLDETLFRAPFIAVSRRGARRRSTLG